jgi:hypothetical protein
MDNFYASPHKYGQLKSWPQLSNVSIFAYGKVNKIGNQLETFDSFLQFDVLLS